MNKRDQNFKIAILTTRTGIFTAHYLVKNLNVSGIIIDRGKRSSGNSNVKLLARFRSGLVRYGLKGLIVIATKKLLHPLLPGYNLAKAARCEDKYFKKIDKIFFKYPYYQKKLEYRNFTSWDKLAHYYNIPIIYVQNINNELSAETLKKWNVDLGILVSGRIIKPHIIEIPRLGFLNKHSSILPRHRGLAAEYWCLYYEDFDSLGVTVHYVQAGLDNGPIVVQKRMRFEKGDTPVSLRFKSSVIGREAIVEAVRIIETTGTKGVPQDETVATQNKRPTIESDKKLYSKLPTLWEKYGI